MSQIVSFPTARLSAGTSARPSVRAAVLDLVARRPAPDVGPDEAEFLAALRRIVEQVPALDLWDRYRGTDVDNSSRIFARFAD